MAADETGINYRVPPHGTLLQQNRPGNGASVANRASISEDDIWANDTTGAQFDAVAQQHWRDKLRGAGSDIIAYPYSRRTFPTRSHGRTGPREYIHVGLE